jgi:hypothetical protein
MSPYHNIELIDTGTLSVFVKRLLQEDQGGLGVNAVVCVERITRSGIGEIRPIALTG